MSYKQHKITKQRKHLESCLNSSQIDAKMATTSTGTLANSTGFGKKNSNFIELKISGKKIKVYIEQGVKNSLSRKNLERFCKKVITRKLFKHLRDWFSSTQVVVTN